MKLKNTLKEYIGITLGTGVVAIAVYFFMLPSHVSVGSVSALACAAKIARRSGARRVAVHSHCGGFANLPSRVARLWTRQTLLTYPTHYFACSHLAARWKFPPSVIRTGNYTVLKNAVDTAALRYDPTLRQATRLQLGLGDKPTVGPVGRFALQSSPQ